jgi:hypothetical protein
MKATAVSGGAGEGLFFPGIAELYLAFRHPCRAGSRRSQDLGRLPRAGWWPAVPGLGEIATGRLAAGGPRTGGGWWPVVSGRAAGWWWVWGGRFAAFYLLNTWASE